MSACPSILLFVKKKLALGIILLGHNLPRKHFNPLPDIAIFGSSNSAKNKDMMSKIWTNGDTII